MSEGNDAVEEIIMVDEAYQNTDDQDYEEDELSGIEEIDGKGYTIIQEHDIDENSILVEEYLADNVHAENENIEQAQYSEEEMNEEDAFYNCNVCGLDFQSVDEHIASFHSGQDVILDIDPIVDESSMMPQIKVETDGYFEENVAVDNDSNQYGFEAEEQDEDGYEESIIVEEPEVDESDVKHSIVKSVTNVATNDRANTSTELVYDIALDTLCRKPITTPMKRKADNVMDSSQENGTAVKYDCKQCDKKFATLRSLSTHVLSQHKKTARKPKEKKAKVDNAVASTAQKQDFTCEVCNTVFLSTKSLKLHARMHFPIKMRTLEEAAEHELNTIPAKEEEQKKKFYCSICDKHYDKGFEEIHVKMHNGEEKFNCSICNKLFKNKSSISLHMSAHQESRVIKTRAEINNIRLPYACQYCGKEFARPHEKVKHERVHTGEKPYECEICGKCFRVSYCLTIHMRTHTDARPFICPHCNKRFKAHSVYNHHLLIHSDERNYKCPYCSKTFKTSVQLSGHKNSHTKPFSCTECNRPFGSLYAVRTHMESHNRPNHNLKHCCEICGAKYARKFALNDHIREQHKDVQVVDVDDPYKKNPAKRPRTNKTDLLSSIQFDTDSNGLISLEDERELQAAGESILPHGEETEVTISGINHFETEEEVVGIEWL